ncbi:hypothetical protein L1O03_04680 [Corynebacterium uropygiale]|uniref:Cell wall hydrolase interfering with FtsZ ring assembly n=1 Tax=Corynebacterium uropygiale TaxID=1775911 RepID=A0A9X1QS06_9CORY|nr:hypothetical protein [Corynebacterium uropygiale]MCF4006479.1 hypothetical protein [Corynebacterium uropygiale]
MSITVNMPKNHSLAASMPRPQAVKGQVWDPASRMAVQPLSAHVRTLSVDDRTSAHPLHSRTKGSSGIRGIGKSEVASQGIVHFLIGGVFGLALMGGLLFLDSADDLQPVGPMPQSSFSAQ